VALRVFTQVAAEAAGEFQRYEHAPLLSVMHSCESSVAKQSSVTTQPVR
jgi:hypothetical protein